MKVGCFELVDMKDIPRGRKIVNSKWVHTYKGYEYGNFINAKSQLVVKGFTQVRDVDYHETTSSTPASAPREDHCNDSERAWFAGLPLGRISGVYTGALGGRYIAASPPEMW